jgi:hypothetical protein
MHFGLSSQGADLGVEDAEQTAQAIERKIDVINFFMAWEWEQPLPTQTLGHIHALGALPAITWEPWHPTEGSSSVVYGINGSAHT